MMRNALFIADTLFISVEYTGSHVRPRAAVMGRNLDQ